MDRSRVPGKWTVGGSAAAASAALMSPAAHAASADGSFQIQLVILNSCRIGTGAGPVGDPAAEPSARGAHPVKVSCTEDTPYSIEFSRSPMDEAGKETPRPLPATLPRPDGAVDMLGDTVTVTIHY